MKKAKPYQQMKTRELAAATKKFDEPFVAEQSRPLTPAEKRQWQQAKRKRGRPKTGQGHQRISVSIERGLLKRVNALAKKRRVTRSKLLADALSAALERDG